MDVGHQGLGRPRGGVLAAADGGGEGGLAAALGTAWAHAVNVRLVLERRGDERMLQVRVVGGE